MTKSETLRFATTNASRAWASARTIDVLLIGVGNTRGAAAAMLGS